MVRSRRTCLPVWFLLVALWAPSYGAEPQPARRIVSLAPHLTELAFAAGAGDSIVATVEFSDYPAQARTIPRIGDAFRIDVERVLALKPDLVLAWASGTPRPLVERLGGLGLRVVSLDALRIADIGEVVRRLGVLGGTGETAARAASEFEQKMALLRERHAAERPISVFVEIDDQPLYTVNGRHVISEVVELCGGRNVFANLGQLAPAIGIEAVIAADPQVILSADTPARLEHWNRWPHIAAVRTGNVYALSADDVSRATTRLVRGAEEICRVLDVARTKRDAG